ncbi:MAG TPA: FHA domain-containing protein [Propionibacteriaceae bacterium]|nr:FHA domain-containing protein [Propionibacteriaceae bacterium]
MPGICEAGHRSTTDDYCDVCGLPVRPAGAAPAAPPPPPARTSQKCPNCGATNPPDALFCEACGYDYTTGTLPRSDLAGMLGLIRPTPPRAEEHPVTQLTPDSPVDAPEPSAPAAEQPLDLPADDSAPEAPVATEGEPVDALAPLTAPDPDAGQEPEVSALGSMPIDDEPPTKGRPAPRREAYVAEIWIDPDWYDVQSSPDAMPSAGLPETVKLIDSNLIGRESRSRNIIPEIDCGIDTGCSRRQAMLTTDGTRWYVEDLGSANGTFVGPASGPLPTDPITGRTELGPDDRIYVGAWTRIVVRKASREEIDALG